MKYIEELETGDCFLVDAKYFILTADYKKNGQRLCVNLKTGCSQWIEKDVTVDTIDIFTFDQDSNIIAIKERKKEQ